MGKPPKGMSLEDYRARHREYVRASQAKRMLDPAYRAKRAAEQRQRSIAHPERKRATQARWMAKFSPAAWRTYRQRYAPTSSPPLGLHVASLWKDDVWAAAARAVLNTVPKHIWDDAVSSLVLAVLEGDVSPADMRKAAARFVTAAWGPHFASLDAIVPGTDGLKLIDLISNETEHF